MSLGNDLLFYVRRQDDAGLSNLACAIMNAPDALELMRNRDSSFYADGVMLADCEADTWASAVDKDVAFVWLRDALNYFCTQYPDRVQTGMDRIDAGTDGDCPSMASELACIIKANTL